MNFYFELLIVILVGLFYLYNPHNNYPLLILIALFLYTILFSTSLTEYGIQTQNLEAAFVYPTIVFLLILCIYFPSWNAKKSIINTNFFILLCIYPLWGIVQQFILQSIITKHLYEVLSFDYTINMLLTCLISGGIFSMLHTHLKQLPIPSFIVGCLWAYFYLLYNNILPLGIYHGILATLYYYFILKVDILKQYI